MKNLKHFPIAFAIFFLIPFVSCAETAMEPVRVSPKKSFMEYDNIPIDGAVGVGESIYYFFDTVFPGGTVGTGRYYKIESFAVNDSIGKLYKTVFDDSELTKVYSEREDYGYLLIQGSKCYHTNSIDSETARIKIMYDFSLEGADLFPPDSKHLKIAIDTIMTRIGPLKRYSLTGGHPFPEDVGIEKIGSINKLRGPYYYNPLPITIDPEPRSNLLKFYHNGELIWEK